MQMKELKEKDVFGIRDNRIDFYKQRKSPKRLPNILLIWKEIVWGESFWC